MKTRVLPTLLFLLVAPLLSAQVVTPYFTRSGPLGFDAAAGATTTIDFQNVLGSSESSHVFPTGLTLSGVTFSPLGSTSVFEVAHANNLGSTSSNHVLYALDGNTNVEFSTLVTLPLGGVLAFGTDIKIDDPVSTGTLTLQLFSDAQSLGTFVTTPMDPLNFNQFQFIGFTSNTPITSVQIGKYTGTNGVSTNANVVLDNVSFGAPVPEPSVYGLVLAGAFLLRLVRRNKN